MRKNGVYGIPEDEYLKMIEVASTRRDTSRVSWDWDTAAQGHIFTGMEPGKVMTAAGKTLWLQDNRFRGLAMALSGADDKIRPARPSASHTAALLLGAADMDGVQVGDWLPKDHRAHREWLGRVVDHVDNNPQDFDPVIKEFKQVIEGDTRIFMLVQSMFDEIPNKKPYGSDPAGGSQVRDYEHMLSLLNHLMTTAPIWTDSANNVGMVGLPIQALLDWPMGTPSGFAVFQDPKINDMLKKVLDKWGEFLCTEESAKQALHEGSTGWFGSTGKQDLEVVANQAADQNHRFNQIFVCDSSAKYHGYKCWDDFFTRHFRDGVRPVASPDDDNVVVSACESKPYNTSYNVQLRDKFWNKGQPYSVRDMLGHDELSEKFAGGTVYQAFLSALSYHRWHAPVSGKVVKTTLLPGTYYSEPLWEGLGDPDKQNADIDKASEATCQGYLAHMAARAVIFFEADNPAIGLMAFIGIGMDEVSTCDITVKQGQHVKKGDEIGMFHFGGSTHCLLFRKDTKVEGFPKPGREANVPVRSQIAVVKH
ncbi:phosphatidylserine decarboxylase family protein [Myriangium duriaei CBS 260.36]|uniref:Phosphatidylserine decarboxylase family protein n=1 Tax=Myriangium duriaei CBS 260.36 TaxID=1168546 RepID=A0A9P4MIZ5_9PEZI|nr:phosphatidylserine decarboxylase family protein [Myriangium duriaei CBS 260.36]